MSKYSLDYYVFLGVLFSLPFGKRIFIPILFLWICLVTISYFISSDFSFPRFKRLLILPILFYFIGAISFFHPSDINEVLFDLQMKLSLCLVPLLYPYNRSKYQLNHHFFAFSFILGLAVASLYLFSLAFYRSICFVNGELLFNPNSGRWGRNVFLGVEYSKFLHASYFALYILVAFLLIGFFYKKWWHRNLFKAILGIIVLVIGITLILLQSRAGILGFGLLALVWLFYILIVKQKYILTLFIGGLFVLLTFLVFPKIDRYSSTFTSVKKTVSHDEVTKPKEDLTLIRLWIWKSAFTVIEEHPWFGVGASNVRADLTKKYVDNGMPAAARYRLNAHNQYLETWLGIGIFGLLALLAMLFVPLWVGIKRLDWLLVGFICLCSVSFMFESMLNSIAGVGFFAIFYTILVSRSGLEASGNAKPA